MAAPLACSTVLLFTLLKGRGEAPAVRLARLQGVLHSALQTSGNRHRLHLAGLGTAKDINALKCPLKALAQLRVLPRGEFFGALLQFRNTRRITIRAANIRHPISVQPAPKVTVLCHGVERDTRRLAQSGAETVAAPVATLRRLAREIESGAIDPAPFSHSVIAFTDLDQGGVAEGDRALFWRAFQVPVFEQYLGLDGSLLAGECEAHSGVHVEPDNAIWETIDSELVVTSLTDRQYPTLRLGTGWTAHLNLDPCDCGKTTPRLLNMARLGVPLAFAAGAR